MQKIINFLRGSVHLEVTGAFPERFLNLCAQAGVGFWALEWPDSTTLRLRAVRGDLKRVRALAEKAMCEMTVLHRAGVPSFAARFRRRYALLAGLALSLVTVCVLSQFILTVEVEGNETVPTAAILEELRRQGVRLGAYGPSINENLVGNAVLLNLKELAWVSVNLHGTRAEVLVRERAPKPEIVDESTPSNVVATAAGIITQIEVLNGDPMFQEGDTVVEGDILISGVMDLREPLYSQQDLGTMTVHADGRVYARTWRTLTAVLPLTAQVKSYTGTKQTSWSLTVLGRRFTLWGGVEEPCERCEYRSQSRTLTLPGGRELPLTLTSRTAREYELAPAQISQERGEEMLREQLEKRLASLMEECEGEVVCTDFVALVRDGMLTVTLTAECREQIGKVVPFEGELGRSLPAPAEPAPEE